MKVIITEEMKLRERIVKYAIKHNNAEAARKYHTSRQNVANWRKRYDGDVRSLTYKSRRPHSHPNMHTVEEIELILEKHRKYSHEGTAQVYAKLLKAGYKRTFQTFMKQLRKLKIEKQPASKRYPKSKFNPLKGSYPGEYVEIDVKYVPLECIGFKSNYARYYQITAIDLYTRKRVLSLVNEHSTFTTSKFLETLEERMGFKIKTVQTDNGREFCNDIESKKSLFEKTLDKLNIKYRRTRPYSPWQNGVVERSHRIDNDLFYSKKRFKSEEEMYRVFKAYSTHTNNIAKRVLNFKTPNEKLEEYKKCIGF